MIGLGSNLIVRDGGVPGVVIRLGRGFNDIDGRSRRIACAPARRCPTSRSRARRRRRHRGARVLSRHSRRDRRRAAHEWRRLWPRDQGRADRSARRRPAGSVRVFANADMHYTYRHCGAPGRRDLHAGAVSRRARRSCGDRRRDGQDHGIARGDAADQEPHRRLDLQEPAGTQGLAADRRRRLPRLDRSAARRCRRCTAIS